MVGARNRVAPGGGAVNLSPRQEIVAKPEPSYAEAMEQLWVEKYTGPVMVHFQSGQPGVVEKLNPEKIRLDTRRK